ncbi:MAG: hypothetical protein ACKO2G_13290 [Verrucomicrobiales bacterium]
MASSSVVPIALGPHLAGEFESLLVAVDAAWKKAATDPLLGHRGVGVPQADALLAEFSVKLRDLLPKRSVANDGPNLYIATQIYKDGGHTGLLGDMARAIEGPARLLITNKHGHHPKKPGPAHLERIGRLAEGIIVLRSEKELERFEELLGWLREMRPRRVILFHHPDDPLPVIAAAASGADQVAIVHHADAIPSLGLHLPGVILIDLNPTAAAFSRAWGLSPALLPMTVPDPGPRPRGFLVRGQPVTATCARSHKLRSEHPVCYTNAVPEILASTGGWHVHIGALEDEMLATILRGMDERGIARDRLIYHELVPSLARALHENDVDVYLSSFPIDGARTNVEVASAGVPYLAFVREKKKGPPGGFSMEGRMEWTNWEDLRQCLGEITKPGFLEMKSALLRDSYLHRHHPDVFAGHLAEIFAGGKGWNDPDACVHDQKALAKLRGEAPGESIPGVRGVSQGPCAANDA